MREGLFVPGPSGNSCQLFIRRICKEDVQVSRTIQLQNLFQLFHVQIGSGKQQQQQQQKQDERPLDEDFINTFSKTHKLHFKASQKKQNNNLCASHTVDNSSEL